MRGPVNRAMILVLVPVLPACPSPLSCPTSLFSEVASHVASTIPLNSQSDCTGASRIPFNSESLTSAEDETCAADPDDGPCVACLRAECCAVVAYACEVDSAATVATCAAVPSVRNCILAAVDDCAAACAADEGSQ